MEPKLLKHLAVVIKAGSITRAAERLGLTQPTLTRSIQLLEGKAGEPLLTRTRYGVRPTELGSRLAEVGNRIMDEAGQAETLVRQWKQGYRYEVRIGVGPLLQFSVMNGFIDSYPQSPNHVVHFKTGSAALLLPELQKGAVDLLLAPAILDLDQSGTERETVFDDETRIFVGRKSRFYGERREVEFDELSDENWILSGASAGLSVAEGYANTPRQPNMIFTGAIDMVAYLLRTSDVVVRLPVKLMLLSQAIDMAHLIDVPGQAARRDIAIWSKPEALQHPAVREGHKRLCDYFRELDRSDGLDRLAG